MTARLLRNGLLIVCLMLALFASGSAALATDPVHWTYEGEEGPEHWGDLSPDFALCSIGKAQTPVDIPASAPLNDPNLTYAYKPSAVNILNNGHTVQVNYDPGSTLALEDSTYELVQFHFHAHSEHTKAGQAAPIELHLVHKNAAGNLAVVGVWLTSGAENAAFAPVFDNLPASASDVKTIAGATVDADALLPAERNYYRYNGSLTTPPCTEGVKWVMLDKNVELSDAQIAAFTALYDNDFRPVQPLNGRTFMTSAEAAAQPVISPAPGGTTLPSTGTAGQPVLFIAIAAGALLISGLYLRRRLA